MQKKNGYILGIIFLVLIICAILLDNFVYTGNIVLSDKDNDLPIEIIMVPFNKLDNDVYDINRFNELNSLANTYGLHLDDGSSAIHKSFSDGLRFTHYFYVKKKAYNCDKEFIVERIRVNKSYIDINGERIRDDELVYVSYILRLFDNNISVARPHWANYKLKDEYTMRIKVEYEAGCGSINGVINGSKWPYDKDFFPLMWGKEMFDNVIFDNSVKYEIKAEFGRSGRYTVKSDDFGINVDNKVSSFGQY